MTVILGVDPGLRHTGWGLIRMNGNQLSFISCGIVSPKAELELAERISTLHAGLCEAIETYKPEEAALEETFVNKSGSSTLKLGQARGGILLTLSLNKLPVYEYSATLVKKSIVGTGRAEKDQLRMMVETLLPASKVPLSSLKEDASDALAIAICHAHQRTMQRRVRDASS